MRNPDPCIQLEILDKTYVSASQIHQLIPQISMRKAREIFREAVESLTSDGYRTIPGLIPLKYVTDMYPLDRKGIERAAKRRTASA